MQSLSAPLTYTALDSIGRATMMAAYNHRYPTFDVWQKMSEREQEALIARVERRQRWSGVLSKLARCVILWTVAIVLNIYPEWVAQQVAAHVPLGVSSFCFAWLMAFSVLAWPLVIELAVERWRRNRHSMDTFVFGCVAVGITMLGIGATTVGLLGGALHPDAAVRIYTICGIISGGLTSAFAWVWHFIRKSAPKRNSVPPEGQRRARAARSS